MKSKNLIEDPRTIYSLTMVFILYEVYKSDLLTSENPLIIIIKVSLIILIFTQLIFLYLCGLSHAKLKKDFKVRLLEIASDIYSFGFQLSFFILFITISFGLIYYYFKDYGYYGYILVLVVNFLISIMTIPIRNKYFEPKIEPGNLFYLIIIFWVLVTTIFIYSKILEAG